jgi:hypothetical protein
VQLLFDDDISDIRVAPTKILHHGSDDALLDSDMFIAGGTVHQHTG